MGAPLLLKWEELLFTVVVFDDSRGEEETEEDDDDEDACSELDVDDKTIEVGALGVELVWLVRCSASAGGFFISEVPEGDGTIVVADILVGSTAAVGVEELEDDEVTTFGAAPCVNSGSGPCVSSGEAGNASPHASFLAGIVAPRCEWNVDPEGEAVFSLVKIDT